MARPFLRKSRLPKLITVPSFRKATLNAQPAAMAVTLLALLGTSHWCEASLPQATTVPLLVKASVCWPPAATAITLVVPLASLGGAAAPPTSAIPRKKNPDEAYRPIVYKRSQAHPRSVVKNY